ncbi:unnamed protein product [Cochlearia groenlandica]
MCPSTWNLADMKIRNRADMKIRTPRTYQPMCIPRIMLHSLAESCTGSTHGRPDQNFNKILDQTTKLTKLEVILDDQLDLPRPTDPSPTEISHFDRLDFSKAKILKLSRDLGRIWTESVREEFPSDRTYRPACVLLLTAAHDTSSMDQVSEKS